MSCCSLLNFDYFDINKVDFFLVSLSFQNLINSKQYFVWKQIRYKHQTQSANNAQKKEEYFKKKIEPKYHSATTVFHFKFKHFPICFVSPTGSLFKSQSFWISTLATQLLLFFQILSRFGAWEILKWYILLSLY